MVLLLPQDVPSLRHVLEPVTAMLLASSSATKAEASSASSHAVGDALLATLTVVFPKSAAASSLTSSGSVGVGIGNNDSGNGDGDAADGTTRDGKPASAMSQLPPGTSSKPVSTSSVPPPPPPAVPCTEDDEVDALLAL